MAEYIEREAAMDAIINDCPDLVFYSKREAIECIAAEPAADVAPVVHGRWEKSVVIRTDTSVLYDYTCSECSIATDRDSNFCPNCGADMRERKGDE